TIVRRAARILSVALDDGGAHEIASRSRGTPRIANRLLRRMRDFAEVRSDGVVSAAAARDGLALFEIDALGLDKVDRAILHAVCPRWGSRRSRPFRGTPLDCSYPSTPLVRRGTVVSPTWPTCWSPAISSSSTTRASSRPGCASADRPAAGPRSCSSSPPAVAA